MKLPMTEDGYPLIFAALFFAVAFTLIGRYWAIFYAFAFIMLLKAVSFAFFFRDPAREIKSDTNTVLSPADGKVLEIVENNSEKIIRIFLSVFNVHIQRSPVTGTVVKLENKKGKFFAANNPKAHKLNKQNIITIKNSKGETFKVHQIVGVIARRMVLWVNENQALKQGDKLGMIKFGSQVDISIPENYSISIKPKDKVYGGLTVLASRTYFV